MSTTAPQYPFDPTGQATTNKITGERQTISPPDWSSFYFICPTATPFFATGLKITLVNTSRVLVEGVDYNLTHRFYDASKQCASPVYGSITFLDRTLSGVIELEYQTLGGDWTLNSDQIATVLANTLLDPRVTTWEEVVNLPYQFPPISHPWDIADMVGASDIVTALNNMVTALLQSGDQGLQAHLADYNNPHRVTAAQVGLGNVQNYPMAQIVDAQAGTSTTLYMNPATVKAAITTFAVTPLNAHIANVSNPHNVTAAQVGLGSVLNYGVASSTDAQTGTSTTLYMTPAATTAAISSQALAPLNTHLADYNNPHQTTAAQVGLGNVPNYAMATLTQAQAGTATDAFMSPFLVMQVMQTGAGGNLTAHINDHSNPHQVTAAQVGLGSVQNYPIATTQQATDGVDTASYMTPALTAAAISNATSTFTAHLSDFNNPHQTTAAQVGLGNVQNYAMATITAAQDGTESTSYMNPALTAAAITAQALTPLNAHIANVDNPHNTTAAQVGAYTTAQVDTLFSNLSTQYLGIGATAADSTKLSGLTLSQVTAQVANTVESQIDHVLFQYAATASTSTGAGTWTLLGQVTYTPPATGNPAFAPLMLEVAGGEKVGEINSPLYRITVSGLSDKDVQVELLSGYEGMVKIAAANDTTVAGVLDIYHYSDLYRNPISVRKVSDPGNAFSESAAVVTNTEPTGITYISPVQDNSPKARKRHSSAGSVGFGQAYGNALSSSRSEMDTLVQRINVAESSSEATTLAAVATNWGTALPNWMRLASWADESYRAASLTGWAWDSTNTLVTHAAGPQALVSLVSEHAVSGDFMFEMLVSSSDVSDFAIGAVIGFTDAEGQPASLQILRDCGALTTLASTTGVPGPLGDTLGIATIGYNLMENNAHVLYGSSTTYNGLSWGDGVSNSAARGTAYVPQSQTAGTNGWASKGAVAIRVTLAGTVLTIEMSDFGAVSGSITYVLTTTVDLSTDTSWAGQALLRASQNEGVRWGFCSVLQPSTKFEILSAPDSYERYALRQNDASGNDTSTLNVYDGTAWVAFNFVDQKVVKPGRFLYSQNNNRLYHALRDGSLEPIQLVAYTPSGAAVLTT